MDSISAVALSLFALSAVAFGYAYAVYPLGMFALARFAGEDAHGRLSEDDLPTVTLVVAAYNEAEVIGAKIENSLALSYPDEKLDIVVFSDASSDGTDEIVESYSDRGVELQRIPGRVGKTVCQNRVVASLETDVVVFSDANVLYDRDAVRALAERFTPGVGCVIGNVRSTGPDGDVEGESLYARFEHWLKALESRTGSVTKGDGAIYAVAREHYVPLSTEAQSDFAEPLEIVTQGLAAKYASNATAWEQTAGSVAGELSRKARIITRSWVTIREYRELFDPRRYGFFSVKLLSHTIFWWLSPVYLGLLGVTSVVLSLTTPALWFDAAAIGVLACGVFAAIGFLLEDDDPAPLPFHVPQYVTAINYTLLVGLWNFFRGHTIVTWETDQRAD
jgi:cellulose synthase/poly-beta-1,6-N-acetylglucosamine synthase-like glycosyltransferase